MMLVNKRLPPFVHHVSLINSLEPKFRWIAFPGLIRGLLIIHAMVYVLGTLGGSGGLEALQFDWQKILEKGELWRLASFLFLPPVFAGGLGLLFMLIILMIGFMISNALEQVWGTFRTSLYCYATMACHVAGITAVNFLVEPEYAKMLSAESGFLLYEAFFLAFCTLFPRTEFRLFFILPVQVWILGLLTFILEFALPALTGIYAVTTGKSSGNLVLGLYPVFSLSPYLIWALPRLLSYARQRNQVAARRTDFQRKALSPDEAFHHCEECGATDSSHPDRDFRVTEGDRELCSACLDESS